MSFDDAVRASGQTREVLLSRYLRSKRIWLLLFGSAALLALFLPVAMLISGIPFSGMLFGRTLSMSFMLAGFSGLMFVRALKININCGSCRPASLELSGNGKPLATGYGTFSAGSNVDLNLALPYSLPGNYTCPYYGNSP